MLNIITITILIVALSILYFKTKSIIKNMKNVEKLINEQISIIIEVPQKLDEQLKITEAEMKKIRDTLKIRTEKLKEKEENERSVLSGLL